MDGIVITKLAIIFTMAFLFSAVIFILDTKEDNFILERLKRKRGEPEKRGFIDDILNVIKPIAQKNLQTSKNKDSIKKMFIKLGKPATEADIIDFENKRILNLFMAGGFGIVLAILYWFASPKDALSVAVCMGSIFCPAYYFYKKTENQLKRQIKKKEKAFEKFFPDAIDLLCVCVEAGLGIDSAIERVGREFSNFSYDVGYEFNRIAKDMLSGVSKQEALKAFAERVEIKDIQSFVAIIIQAEKMGASISSSLATCADSLRTKRKQRLEALVASASTKMTLPLVLCLLPATFTVVLTPALIQLMESLGKMNGFH